MTRSCRNYLRKLAKDKNSYHDVQSGGNQITEMLPVFLHGDLGLGELGDLAARMDDTSPNKNEMKDLSEYSFKSLIPGFYKHRDARRDMYVDSKLSKGENVNRSRLAEKYGSLVNMALLGLLSGVGSFGIGKAMGMSTGDSARVGLGVGGAAAGTAGLASILGRVGGLFAGARDDKEHADYLKDSVAAQYLIPGVAGYQSGRRARMKGNWFR